MGRVCHSTRVGGGWAENPVRNGQNTVEVSPPFHRRREVSEIVPARACVDNKTRLLHLARLLLLKKEKVEDSTMVFSASLCNVQTPSDGPDHGWQPPCRYTDQ